MFIIAYMLDADPKAWSRATATLLTALGQQVTLARRRKHWTEAETAARARISRGTLRKIEAGTGSAASAAVLEVCWLLGVPILGATDLKGAEALLRDTRVQLDALPTRVRPRRASVPSDEF